VAFRHDERCPFGELPRIDKCEGSRAILARSRMRLLRQPCWTQPFMLLTVPYRNLRPEQSGGWEASETM
jgi:hypothetical protein